MADRSIEPRQGRDVDDRRPLAPARAPAGGPLRETTPRSVAALACRGFLVGAGLHAGVALVAGLNSGRLLDRCAGGGGGVGVARCCALMQLLSSVPRVQPPALPPESGHRGHASLCLLHCAQQLCLPDGPGLALPGPGDGGSQWGGGVAHTAALDPLPPSLPPSSSLSSSGPGTRWLPGLLRGWCPWWTVRLAAALSPYLWSRAPWGLSSSCCIAGASFQLSPSQWTCGEPPPPLRGLAVGPPFSINSGQPCWVIIRAPSYNCTQAFPFPL